LVALFGRIVSLFVEAFISEVIASQALESMSSFCLLKYCFKAFEEFAE
jgi:hypothetical protein